MTTEEAIKCLKVELHIWESDCKSKHAVKDALKMAITALEQEPILDKIRAEIRDLLGQRTMNDNRASGIWACIDIIDKYKAKSEG